MQRSAMMRAALAVLLAGGPPVFAQDLGTVGLRTVQAQLAVNATCTGSAQIFTTNDNNPAYKDFRNLGQVQHQISLTSTAASVTIEIDGLDNANIPLRISNPQVSFVNGATTSYLAQGSGYYPNIRVSVTCTAAATFSLSYTGSAAAPTTVIGAPGTPPQIFNTLFANVQGVVANGANDANVNPVFMCLDQFDTVTHTCTAPSLTFVGQAAISNLKSLVLGQGGNGPNGSDTGYTDPNNSTNGPLGVFLKARSPGSNTIGPANLQNNANVGDQGSTPGLLVKDFGYLNTNTTTITVTNQNIALWISQQTGALQTCNVTLNFGTITGTAPTLDVFLQDGDGSAWNDRLHFTQITNTGGNFSGGITSSVGQNPVVMVNSALAAGSRLDGPIAQQGRLHFVVGGTTPSFTFTYWVVCR